MDKMNIRVEAPKKIGEETEFFLQRHEANTVATFAHIHNAVELLYIKHGDYRIVLDGEEFFANEGDLVLFASNSIHNVYTLGAPKHGYYVIKIPPSAFFEFTKWDRGAEYIMRFSLNRAGMKCHWRREELSGGDIERVLLSLIRELEERLYASEVAIRLRIIELLVCILRESGRNSLGAGDHSVGLVYKVMLHVRNNYALDFDERELAKDFGMSYSYFSRSFKRVTGMTFKKYLNLTRIRRAEQMLSKNTMTISEIATGCGYNNVSYFISVYRSMTGKTPYKAMKSAGELKD